MAMWFVTSSTGYYGEKFALKPGTASAFFYQSNILVLYLSKSIRCDLFLHSALVSEGQIYFIFAINVYVKHSINVTVLGRKNTVCVYRN